MFPRLRRGITSESSPLSFEGGDCLETMIWKIKGKTNGRNKLERRRGIDGIQMEGGANVVCELPGMKETVMSDTGGCAKY